MAEMVATIYAALRMDDHAMIKSCRLRISTLTSPKVCSFSVLTKKEKVKEADLYSAFISDVNKTFCQDQDQDQDLHIFSRPRPRLFS